jgi:hypothetical protein
VSDAGGMNLPMDLGQPRAQVATEVWPTCACIGLLLMLQTAYRVGQWPIASTACLAAESVRALVVVASKGRRGHGGSDERR